MQQAKRNFEKLNWANLSKWAVIVVLLTGCLPARSLAQQPGQKTFASAEDASEAAVAAAQNNDEKMMLEILGPEGKDVVSSGDATEDAENRANFVRRYHEMHRLVRELDGTMILYIGAHNWPWPIPLVNKGKSWYFDTPAGKKEILYRRIGRNEISAIHVCQELVAAQKEYYSQNNEYAQRIFSEEGQHNGLYWKAAEGQPESPIGPLVAWAVAREDAKSEGGGPVPFHGYFFRTLRRQGASSPGGAKDYIVNGKMTEGFAFIAFPAEYRSSGVVTFIVNQDGVVYQKDLGVKTEDVAKAIREYNVNSSWEKAEEPPEETAGEQKAQ